MRSIILTTVLSLSAALSPFSAKADCDTGFNMRTMVVTESDFNETTPDQTFEIVYFICAEGGAVGDPDLGWKMVHLTSRDGREIRTTEASAPALRMMGIAR